ncbi:MAG: sialate O-acetylesterase [Prolixibacteraceae bacterium]|nr:sialate O-acetylesterase [Prolixibacteraceae bacterium]
MKPTIIKKLFILSIILIVITPATLVAQKNEKPAYSTSPNMPQHYANRVALFEAEPVVTGKILFLGNSITEGGNWKELLNDETAINRGIGGDVSFGVLDRLDDVIQRKPEKVFLLIGINDLAQFIPEKVIAENCQKIVERIKKESSETKVYIQSVLPVNPKLGRFPKNYDLNDKVITTNKFLKKAAKQTKCPYIDIYNVFLNDEELLNPDYTHEGLHLNQQGYKVWVDCLKKEGYL